MKKITLSEKLTYGVGDFACNIIFTLITIYLFYYYTDIIKLPVLHIAILFLIVRIIQGAYELIVYKIMSVTNTRLGKYRPFIIISAIPCSVFLVLCFSKTTFNNTIYYFITLIMLSLLYSTIHLPYLEMSSSISNDIGEKTILSIIRILLSMFGTLTVNGLMLPLVHIFGQGNAVKGFSIAIYFFAAIVLISLLFTFFGTVEHITINKMTYKRTLKEQLILVFKNKPLIILLNVIIFYTIGLAATQTIVIFFFKYVIKRIDLLPSYLLTSTLSILFGILIMPKLTKSLGKRNTVILGFVISSLAYLGIYIGGYRNISMLYTLNIVISTFLSFTEPVISSMIPETILYGEWKTYIKADRSIYKIISYCKKIALGLGVLIIGISLDSTHYVPNSFQTTFSLHGILIIFTLFPMLCFIICSVIIYLYDLDT